MGQWTENDPEELEYYEYDVLVIGSGCAALKAADTLWDLGCRKIAVLTEGLRMGTSRNTGSDKQTYYKLSLCGEERDSVQELAENLFSGGSVHGDLALAEAAGSVRCFMKLVDLGVPFPCNVYGEYAGYQTDHDRRQRATSAGPLTSAYMTEALERSVREKQIRIHDRMLAVRLLCREQQIYGVLALNLERKGAEALSIFAARKVIMATGGPAGIYAQTVYPESQTGMSGMAIEAGARMNNLQEWQYGLASIQFRWNVSGSYQQVLPRYISVDADGREYEFLNDFFASPEAALEQVFLKGYQWPFDIEKLKGSSIIDFLVWKEMTEKGRDVYLDFRTDPSGIEAVFDGRLETCTSYLRNSDALTEIPAERLRRMNPAALELYASHGIDLYREPLQIAVCAQHCNGGIDVDSHWESSIRGLYAAGECAGTFGVYRPGGSALNSTQVGAMRAAEHIAATMHQTGENSREQMEVWFGAEIRHLAKMLSGQKKEQETQSVFRELQKRMSVCAAQIRIPSQMTALRNEIEILLKKNPEPDQETAENWFREHDCLVTQHAVLSSMIAAAEAWGSRGGSLVTETLQTEDILRHTEHIAETRREKGFDEVMVLSDGRMEALTERCPVRPIPERNNWFEAVWRAYRERHEQESAGNQKKMLF